MKETEREILLNNIKNLPDSEEGESQDESQNDSNENGSHLFSIVNKSPNPNFVILDRDILESYKIDLAEPSSSNTKLPNSDSKNSETDA